MAVVNYGTRIKYQEQGKLLVSYRIFENENRTCRIIIDTEELTYKLVDPITGFVQRSGGEGVNNLEVLLRHAKKAIKAYLNITFDKEKRATENVNE